MLIVCPDCGRGVSSYAPGCHHCGRPFAPAAPPQPADPMEALAQARLLGPDAPQRRRQVALAKKRKDATAGVVVVSVLAVCAFALVVYPCSSPSRPPPPDPAAEVAAEWQKLRSRLAWDARAVVLRVLKSPSTADFPASTSFAVINAGHDRFRVSSFVDSQNGFGAMIRSHFVVTFFVGEDRTQRLVERIEVNGNVVFGGG